MNLPEDIFLKLILAVIIGGSIGAEREYHTKSAGFRTLTLICIGATIFTIFSQILGDPGNRDRVASNIATGIGFVGAGVIFKGDFGVNGITTAAMIWVTASLGMAILLLLGRDAVIAPLQIASAGNARAGASPVVLLALQGFSAQRVVSERSDAVSRLA